MLTRMAHTVMSWPPRTRADPVGRGSVKESGEAVALTENHLYRLQQVRIVEWWPEGGPPVG